jgi:MipA family protein
MSNHQDHRSTSALRQTNTGQPLDPRKKRSGFKLLVACFSTLAAGAAFAQFGGEPPAEGMSQDLEVSVGLGVASGPSYLGSDQRRTRALPLLNLRWRSGWFAGVGGVGYRFGGSEPLTGGLKVSFDPGRKESDSPYLSGMGDIKSRPEFGGFADYRLLPFLSIGGSMKYGGGNDHRGLLGELNLRGFVPISERQRVMLGITATAANQKAMQSQFGVTQDQSSTSGYAVYSPSSGIRDLTLTAGYALNVTPQTMLMLNLSSTSLLNEAKDSPLTRKTTSARAMAAIVYKF